MQRRLFLIFLLLCFVPAAAILLLNWRMSQHQLAYLDSPGLRLALESSLELAREVLAQEKRATQDEADALAEALQAAPEAKISFPASYSWRLSAPQAAHTLPRAGDLDPYGDSLGLPPTLPEPMRISHGGRAWLVAETGLRWQEEEASLRLARPLDPALLSQLDQIALGSGRFRQLHLFYGDLLRGNVLLTLAIVGVGLLILSLWLSRRLARQIAGPLTELAKSAAVVAGGDLEHQVDLRAPDEIGDLVAAFNAMTRGLQRSQAKLVRAERVAAWQGMARRLAHEIKNPLTPINLALHRIAKKSEDGAVRESIAAALEETQHLQRLADEFSRFARLPAPVLDEVDLVALLRSVAHLYEERGQLELVCDAWPESLPVSADAGLLRQVFTNLLKNAAEAMGSAGALILRWSPGAEGQVVIELQDSGPGFPGDPEAFFEPYATTKESGSGLGLAIARRIVEDHGGRLSAQSIPAGGACLRLELPREKI